MKVNSVLSKELKIMIRSWKTSGLITFYLLILGFVSLFFTLNFISIQTSSAIEVESFNMMYFGLALVQLFMLVFIIAPSMAGAISGEREKQTLDILLSTKLSPLSIITGKLLSALGRIVLLIISSFPIFIPVLLFGDISFGDLLLLSAYNVVIAFTVECIGLFFSTYVKKSSLAFIFTYGVILLFSIGTILIFILYTNFFDPKTNYDFVSPIFYINPISGLGGLVSHQLNIPSSMVGFLGGAKGFKVFLTNTIFDLILSGVLIFLSSKKLDPLSKLKIFR